MIEEKAEIAFNNNVAPDTYLMGLRADGIARSARPGQFVMIRVADTYQPLLRRPFSICSVNKDGLMLILYRRVGVGTGIMSGLEKRRYLSVVGPLGNGFGQPDVPTSPILIGGGIGVAPLLFLAGNSGNDNLQFLAGFTTASQKIPLHELLGSIVSISFSTDDGTEGYRGFVTDLLLEYLEKLEHKKNMIRLYSCGPLMMLKAVAGIAHEKKIPCLVSLEAHMACGIGACQGCAIKASSITGRDYLHVCKDGPVFPSEYIDWDRI